MLAVIGILRPFSFSAASGNEMSQLLSTIFETCLYQRGQVMRIMIIFCCESNRGEEESLDCQKLCFRGLVSVLTIPFWSEALARVYHNYVRSRPRPGERWILETVLCIETDCTFFTSSPWLLFIPPKHEALPTASSFGGKELGFVAFSP